MARWISATVIYLVLISSLGIGFSHSPVASNLEVGLGRVLAAFALAFAPLWFFGLVNVEGLKRLPGRAKIALPGLCALPYYVLRAGGGDFQWSAALVLSSLPVVLAGFLALVRLPRAMTSRDGVVLVVIVVVYYLNLPSGAWPQDLRFFSKLYLADVVLYLFLIVRPLRDTGYSLIPSPSAFAIAGREWALFSPIAVVIGELLGFIHFHAASAGPGKLFAQIVITFLIIALPEELFFRAVLENLLETRIEAYRALVVAAILFGLSHFNHGARFNWRYVLLAAIAGIFYGRAWRARRQILASVMTHTAVDVVWSLWFR